MTSHTLTFADEAAREVSQTGGKGAGLAEMTGAGLPVAPGFVVTASAYHDFLDANDLRGEIADLLASGTDVAAIEAHMSERLRRARPSRPRSRSRCARSTPHSATSWGWPTCRSPSGPARPRRTPPATASPASSRPGSTWSARTASSSTCLRCYASVFTGRVLDYAIERGIDLAEVEMAVVVQKTVRARAAGVMFTLDPISGDRSRIVLEASWGLGLAVVGGEVNPDRYVVAKVGMAIDEQIAGDKHLEYRDGHGTTDVAPERRTQLCLTDEEVIALATLGKQIENTTAARKTSSSPWTRTCPGVPTSSSSSAAPRPCGAPSSARRSSTPARASCPGSPGPSAAPRRHRRTPTAMADPWRSPDAPRLLTTPVADVLETTRIGEYVAWLAEHRGLSFPGYPALWQWSVDDLDGFWSRSGTSPAYGRTRPYDAVLGDRHHARRASGSPAPAQLRRALPWACPRTPTSVAVVGALADPEPIELTFGELAEQVRRARAGLRRLGVGRGDRVVAYLPEHPRDARGVPGHGEPRRRLGHAARRSSAPQRHRPLRPDRAEGAAGRRRIPLRRQADRPATPRCRDARRRCRPCEHVVARAATATGDDRRTPSAGPRSCAGARRAARVRAGAVRPPVVRPVLSGTTGMPKAIVHGHGGILLEHLKKLGARLGPRPRRPDAVVHHHRLDDVEHPRVRRCSTRASIVMIDGNPLLPRPPQRSGDWPRRPAPPDGGQPRLPDGLSQGGHLSRHASSTCPALRQLGAAGSPLPPEASAGCTSSSAPTSCSTSAAAGTDVCTGLVQGSPLLPVWAGEMSAPASGSTRARSTRRATWSSASSASWSSGSPCRRCRSASGATTTAAATGRPTSTPIPGVWRHGDWIRFLERGSCVITGRSDATLNRGGVRSAPPSSTGRRGARRGRGQPRRPPRGPARRHRRAASCSSYPARGLLDDDFRARVRRALRTSLSPRHVPDLIEGVQAIPRHPHRQEARGPGEADLPGCSRHRRGQGRRPRGRLRTRRLHQPGADRRATERTA